ncbi:MAG: DUF1572 family protein [Bacteroidia bacterium]|nr:DUF1572 family protein [Bacteroidia bacterium]
MESTLFTLLMAEVRHRLIGESIPRVRTCLHLLPEQDIWYRPHAGCNTVGNLVLHLCGNARQWIVSGLGGRADTRRRQAEFDEQGPIPRSELLALLDDLEQDLLATLAHVTPDQLVRTLPVQTFQETGVTILVHVTEHFSYHVGQITWITKWLTGADTGYYAGQVLE